MSGWRRGYQESWDLSPPWTARRQNGGREVGLDEAEAGGQRAAQWGDVLNEMKEGQVDLRDWAVKKSVGGELKKKLRNLMSSEVGILEQDTVSINENKITSGYKPLELALESPSWYVESPHVS